MNFDKQLNKFLRDIEQISWNEFWDKQLIKADILTMSFPDKSIIIAQKCNYKVDTFNININ